MSMISPNSYKEMHKDKSLKQLQKERDRIIRFMKKYENHELPEDDYTMHPSPGVRYSCNKDYLLELLDLIEERLDDYPARGMS